MLKLIGLLFLLINSACCAEVSISVNMYNENEEMSTGASLNSENGIIEMNMLLTPMEIEFYENGLTTTTGGGETESWINYNVRGTSFKQSFSTRNYIDYWSYMIYDQTVFTQIKIEGEGE